MAIIRSPRPEGRYVVLDKAISEDASLSWAARGLLVFLLGKPDAWTVRVSHLVQQTEGARIATGRDGVYALLGELIAAGYVVRHGQARESGTFGEASYVVYDSPHTAEPDTAEPDTAEPHTAEPHTAEPYTAEPDLSNKGKATKNEASKEGGTAKRAGAREPDFALPAWVPADAWADFVESRRKLRVPLTPAAVRLALRDLDRLRSEGEDPRAVLEQSVMRGWRGLFSTQDRGGKGGKGGDMLDRVRRSAEAFANGGAA